MRTANKQKAYYLVDVVGCKTNIPGLLKTPILHGGA